MIYPDKINILIACEESQAEQQAFSRRGFNAFSCDIQKARFDPSHHIKGDVTPFLRGCCDFTTEDGVKHHVDKWHFILAHPPCTYLCKVSSVHMVQNGVLNKERYSKMSRARSFFFECLNATADFVAVENPLPMARAELPQPDCFVHPSWFGVKYTKKTLYWLKNLPPLMAGAEFAQPKQFVRSSRGKYRSRTFPQVANAIAEQWGNYILDELNKK